MYIKTANEIWAGILPGLMLLLACVGTFMLSTPNAQAQNNSNLCRNLNSQLVSLRNSTSRSNSKKYRQYESAIRKQQLQIGKAQRAARRNGCTGVLKNRNRQCKRINSSLQKMATNLNSLKRTKAKLSGGTGVAKKMRNVRHQLKINGCNGSSGVKVASQQAEKKSRRRTLLEQIFGVKTYSDQGGVGYRGDGTDDSVLFAQYGTYRTLCVRKSDGYYFPISFSTVPERFASDDELCQNMCPSSEVGLYVHRMPSQDSEDMINYRTEIPYAQEPFAFAYRKSHNPEHKCRFSVAGISQSVDAAPTGEIESDKSETIRIGVPIFRTDPSEVPDAYDNQVDSLTLDGVKNYLSEVNNPGTAIAQREFDGGKKIRIVGPAFFPVQ